MSGNASLGGPVSVSQASTVAAALVEHDVPDVSPDEVRAAASYVDDCIAAMPDPLRAGVSVAGIVCASALAVLGRGDFRRLPAERRRALAARLSAAPIPVLGEYFRMARGLGLVSVYEGRSRAGGPQR